MARRGETQTVSDTQDADRWSFRQTLIVLAFIAVAVGGAAFVTIFREASGDHTGSIVFLLVFGVFLFVMVRFKQAAQVYEKVFLAYMHFATVMLVMTAVPAAFLLFSRAVVGKWPLWLQIATLTAWGILLAGALALIATKSMRNRMLERFVRVSVGLPAAYSFSVLMLASLFFSSVSFVLLQEGKLALAPGSSPDVTLASLSDFFLWHFLDAVPLLKIPETLKWGVPLTYTSGTVGLIVLVFKVVVILPVIGAFTWYAARETGKQVPAVAIEPTRTVIPTGV
jgi:hypothetical protein